MVIGVGLALTARAADLPEAQSLALAATMALALGSSLAGTAAVLAVEAMASSTGTAHPARLGGLAQTMPRTSAALAACLLGVAALPPGIGFAALWLLFQALLGGPRTGGLIDQVPPALAAAVIALSAAIATAASVRLIGVAMLGRPRTPQGAGAREILGIGQVVLATMAALSLIAGIIPAMTLRTLADAAVREVTGSTQGVRGDLMMLPVSPASPGYAALPVLALLALATGCAILAVRWLRRDTKPAGLWFGGMTPPAGFPFGEPMAQSAGTGFLPPLPALPALPRLKLPAPPRLATVLPAVALWLLLAAFGTLLLILAIAGSGA
jgi:NADH:ubiquinone oxidoreductase subunit 5 (subunit L)/multisubunit Na+/H+ antiporter MnhA subunit